MRPHACLALAALVTIGCAGQGAHYGLGYAISNGAAVLPPTASRGTTAMLNYHEQAGALARAILLVVSAAGLKNPDGDTSSSVTYEHTVIGDTVYTTKTTTTTFTPTTPEERATREAAIADFSQNVAPGIMNNDLPVELDIGLASPSFGGDTSGGYFTMAYQVPLTQRSAFSLGFGFAGFTYHGRMIDDVTSDGTTITSTTSMRDLEYSMIGFPLKLQGAIANRTSLFFQWDLNIATLTSDQASPFTLGLHVVFPIISFKAIMTSDRFDPGATTFGVEAILGI
ncbi:MAG: hypothetical protein NT062_14505 [Proteobacteria bacterium]|nr:hypothetical protein [Pseudomonadota bacterium]